MHLVLRVQTDDALKLETEGVAERLREELATAQHRGRLRHGRAAHAHSSCEGVPTGQDAGVPARSPTSRPPPRYDRAVPGAGGSYTFS